MNRNTIAKENKEMARGCGPFAPINSSAESLRLAIFERVRAEGVVPRAAIAKDLAISPATVTTQSSALIEMGLIEEQPLSDLSETVRGRPPIGLRVARHAYLVGGMKLSDREHSAVIYDFAGNQIASATQSAQGESDIAEISKMSKALLQQACRSAGLDVKDLSAVGVGLPGFVNRSTGVAHWSPLLDDRMIDVAAHLTQAFGSPVSIDNDANLIALAELWFGAGRQVSDFAVVTIEHGVGMGLVIDHKLYAGARGMGLELGHTKVALDGALCRCGQRGCLEAYVADYALLREASFATDLTGGDQTADGLLESLYLDSKAGNPTARLIFERAGKYLAMGMGNVANLFDPQLIILSSGRLQVDDLYSDQIIAEMKRHALNTGAALPPIQTNTWGDLVWASGAAAMALQTVTERHLGDAQVSAV